MERDKSIGSLSGLHKDYKRRRMGERGAEDAQGVGGMEAAAQTRRTYI